MTSPIMKSYVPKEGDVKNQSKWYVIDATDVVLGRLASFVASRLRGKHKPIFTPHAVTGDKIIIINAGKIGLTGDKLEGKVYRWHTGFPGGVKERTAKQILTGKHAERVLKGAIRTMLGRGTLRNRILENLYVYADANHPHEAQKPEALEFGAKQNPKNVIRSAA